jgi:hypothetical protein
MRRFAIALGLSGCVACHNAMPAGESGNEADNRPGAPTRGEAPSPPTAPLPAGPALFTFVSGESQEPVASARVTLEGHSYLTNGAGQVAVERMASLLEVDAPGFIERRALARADRFSLWPRTSPTGLDEDFTARIVYNCAAPRCADGGEPLGRIPQGAVALRISRELSADPLALAAIHEAAELWTATTRGEVTFVPGGPGAVVVDLSVDPTDAVIQARGAAGVTRRQYAGRAISRAQITLRSVELARRLALILHELGHAFGLAHSPRLGDVMWNGPELYESSDLSGREKLAVALMLQRASGNRFPDSEDALLGSAAARVTTVTTCVER